MRTKQRARTDATGGEAAADTHGRAVAALDADDRRGKPAWAAKGDPSSWDASTDNWRFSVAVNG